MIIINNSEIKEAQEKRAKYNYGHVNILEKQLLSHHIIKFDDFQQALIAYSFNQIHDGTSFNWNLQEVLDIKICDISKKREEIEGEKNKRKEYKYQDINILEECLMLNDIKFSEEQRYLIMHLFNQIEDGTMLIWDINAIKDIQFVKIDMNN